MPHFEYAPKLDHCYEQHKAVIEQCTRDAAMHVLAQYLIFYHGHKPTKTTLFAADSALSLLEERFGYQLCAALPWLFCTDSKVKRTAFDLEFDVPLKEFVPKSWRKYIKTRFTLLQYIQYKLNGMFNSADPVWMGARFMAAVMPDTINTQIELPDLDAMEAFIEKSALYADQFNVTLGLHNFYHDYSDALYALDHLVDPSLDFSLMNLVARLMVDLHPELQDMRDVHERYIYLGDKLKATHLFGYYVG